MRLYLSKSNLVDPERYMKVRHMLNVLYDCDVIEYKGGVYTNELLLSSDIMLMLTPEFPNNEGVSNVGRGQFTQYQDFDEGDNIFLIKDLAFNDIKVSLVIEACRLNSVSWKENYAFIQSDPEMNVSLSEYVPLKVVTKTNKTKPKLIVIDDQDTYSDHLRFSKR